MPIMPSKYTFTEYSPAWAVMFEQEAARLLQLLGDELISVHHIGSTAVPGLAAKPIIDVLPVTRDLGRIDELAPALVDAGYTAWGEYGIAGRRYFTKDQDNVRTHNVHVFEHGRLQIERHLAFRDFLRSHDAVRDEYGALKREVYARHPDDIEAYMDGKDAWIKHVEREAVAWYRRRQLRR